MWLFVVRSSPNMFCCLLLVTLLANVCYSSAADLKLFTCADDNHWVFVDGVPQGNNTGSSGNCCKGVTVTVTPSTKVIAVQVLNIGGGFGGWRGSFSDGTVVNATTWKCTTTYNPGWTTPGYVVGSEWSLPAQGVCKSCFCRPDDVKSNPTWMWTDPTFNSTDNKTIYCLTTLPNPCASNPCQNQGTCFKDSALSTVATCICSPGFIGSNCATHVVPLTISQVNVTEIASTSASTADVQVTWSVSPVPDTSLQQYYHIWVQFRPDSSELWINASSPYQTSQTVSLLTRGVTYIFRVVSVRDGVGISNGDNSSAAVTFISNCTNQKWGAACTQPCGQCSIPQCDTVTGQCVNGSNGCLLWYTSDYCNISIVTCPVNDLSVGIIADTSARATWTCNGYIPSQFYYFSINYSDASSTVFSQSATITGAQPQGVYDMTVTVAMCRTQYSVINCTDGQTITTSCGVPDSPDNVNVSINSYSTDSNKYTISWNPPTFTRCSNPVKYIVTVWEISSRPKRDSAEDPIVVYNTTTTNTFIDDAVLQYNNIYSASVIAVGPQGSSNPSSPSQNIQPQPQPPPTTKTTPVTSQPPSTNSSSPDISLTIGLAVGLGVGIPLIILLIVFLVWRHRRNNQKSADNMTLYPNETYLTSSEPTKGSSDYATTYTLASSLPSPPQPKPEMELKREQEELERETELKNQQEQESKLKQEQKSKMKQEQASDVNSNSIAIKVLQRRTRQMKELHQFEEQFKSFPGGVIKSIPMTEASKSETKIKNRYNIKPYDFNRVILKADPARKPPTYINASYIDGYSEQHKYIASQAPKKEALEDFYHMLWEQRCSTIVMLTNLMDNGKPQCEQYWPQDVSKGMKCGAFKIRLISADVYTHHIIRTFILTTVSKDSTEESLSVTQFHFTAWPDKSVPDHCLPLVMFHQLVTAAVAENDSGPLLVHCSAGAGRTGTFIALDILVQQAIATGEVDVVACVHKLRQQRMDMVQKAVQYEFLHDLLLYELVSTGRLEVDIYVNVNGSSDSLEQEYRILNTLQSIVSSVTPSEVGMHNMDKNRLKEMIPADRDRPELMTLKHSSHNYINAVFVSGIRKAENYVITQSPLPNTVENFWSLVFDYNCSVIVTLDNITGQDEDVPIFWPPSVTTAHGLLTLSCVSDSPVDSQFFSQMYTLTCGKFEKTQKTVQHIYASVQPTDSAEKKHNVLSRAVAELDAVRVGEDQRILIHCRDGVRLSTVMCALLIGIEQKKVSQVVDLSTVVQLVRLTRPQAIRCLDDYKLFHHLMKTYQTQDQTYANWSSDE